MWGIGEEGMITLALVFGFAFGFLFGLQGGLLISLLFDKWSKAVGEKIMAKWFMK